MSFCGWSVLCPPLDLIASVDSGKKEEEDQTSVLCRNAIKALLAFFPLLSLFSFPLSHRPGIMEIGYQPTLNAPSSLSILLDNDHSQDPNSAR